MSEPVAENIYKIEEKKQNDITNRREARRRKILENAKSRLDKLSGTESGSSSLNNRCNNHSPETYSDPEIEHPEIINNFNPTFTINEETPPLDWSTSSLFNTAVVTPTTKLDKVLSTRIHIILSSAFTYFLHVVGPNAIISQSIFCLFLALECLELFKFQRERQLSPLENILLMLCGIKVTKAKVLIHLFGLLNRMICDLGLFLFSFVLSHTFYSFVTHGLLNESFHTF